MHWNVCITNPSLWVFPSLAWVICRPPASHRPRCSSWGLSHVPPPSPHLRRLSWSEFVLGWAPAVFLPDDLISPALLTECPETRSFNFKLSLKFMQSIKSWTIFLLSTLQHQANYLYLKTTRHGPGWKLFRIVPLFDEALCASSIVCQAVASLCSRVGLHNSSVVF